MKARLRALLFSLLVMLATVFLVNCSPYSCRVTFGNSTCNPSGSGIGSGGGNGGGGGGGGGSTIDASNATSLVYYSDTLQGAGWNSSTLLPLSNYVAPATSNIADQMSIVNKKFLYVPSGGTTLEGFSIDRNTGLLTPVPGSPYTVSGGTADGAWSDPLGRFLFVGSEFSADIWVYQINQTTGALTLTTGSPFTTGFISADIMTVDASGKFLYVGQGLQTDGVAAFSIDQTTGALTQVPGSPFFLGIAQVHASPTGEFLLGVADIQDAPSVFNDPHVFVYSINATTGIPTIVGSFLTVAAPFEFAISPNGKFVYTFGADLTTGLLSPIEGFSMNTSTGTLSSLGASFSSLPTTQGCQFEQSGAAMFCINSLFSGNTLFVLGASSTNGALSHLVDLTVTPNNFPFAVTD